MKNITSQEIMNELDMDLQVVALEDIQIETVNHELLQVLEQFEEFDIPEVFEALEYRC